jgi:hypothetical protein
MRNLPGKPDFTKKAAKYFGIRAEFGPQCLERKWFVQEFVVNAVNFSHAATAYQGLHAVTPRD